MNLKNNIAVSESGFVFNPATGESFSVNPVGLQMLNLLRQGLSEEQIVNGIDREFQAEKFNIERDLQDFIDIMKQYHLMQDENE